MKPTVKRLQMYNGEYIKPSKATERIMPVRLSVFEENRQWLVQLKKNGTSTVIIVRPDHSVFAIRGDGGKPHLNWQFTEKSRFPFTQLPSQWFVFHGDLLHNRVKGFRDINYVYDISVYRGEKLYGNTYAERYDLLIELFALDKQPKSAFRSGYIIVHPNLWIPINFKIGFKKLFDSLTDPEDEGLVLKKFNALWNMRDNKWLLKCRKPTKNYGY